jgi:AcrR family transcriptional regulator
MTTKKIQQISRQLFYENGIANTRLQQIADAAGISVGNLAYHYKNKEAIVSAVYEQVFSDLAKLLNAPLKQNSLSDFDVFFDAIFHFVHTYKFCFNNVWEIARNHPDIQAQWEEVIKKLTIQTQKRIDFHIKRGTLKKEPYKGAYKILVQQLFINFHFWIPQQILKGKAATLALFKGALWNLLYPYLTGKGLAEKYEL